MKIKKTKTFKHLFAEAEKRPNYWREMYEIERGEFQILKGALNELARHASRLHAHALAQTAQTKRIKPYPLNGLDEAQAAIAYAKKLLS